MKILLVQCPCSYGTAMPPLGLAYLSSFLKKNNYNSSVLDLNIILYTRVNEEHKDYWKNNKGYCWYLKEVFDNLPFVNEDCYNELIGRILSIDCEILGFSIQNTSALFTLEIIKRIKAKEPAKKIILGGPNCYNVTENDFDFKLLHNLQTFADIVVIGEGEQILLNALHYIETGKPLDECKGIAIPREDRWVFNGLAKPVLNLDDLPYPDFDAYDLTIYTDRNALPVITSRGCVMRCAFCTDTYFWSPYRHRSAQNVLTEIIKLQENYRIGFISFNDSLINGNLKNFLYLCNLLIDRNLGLTWAGNCRIDKRLNFDLLQKMKKAGCAYLILGIESGSNKILGLMRKGFVIEEVEQFLRDCNKVGIYVVTNWVVGFPGETEEDFMATVSFILQHRELIKKNVFNLLAINQFSYLERHKEEFGIVLNGPHLGLWSSVDGKNTIEIRNSRLQYLEGIENRINKHYDIVRQTKSNSFMK